MKILIVSRYFAPDNTVGAIRWTKFAKYLTRLGHDVTVYAMEPKMKIKDPILERDAKEILRVYTIRHGRFYRTVHDFFAAKDPTAGTGKLDLKQALRGEAVDRDPSPGRPSAVLKIMEKALMFSYHVMNIWSEDDFVRMYRRYTKADSLTYDVVIGTWSTNASLRVARDMKKRGRAKRFVADFRDKCVSSWPELTGNRDTARLLKKTYRDADLVTVTIEEQAMENNVPASIPHMLLENGFDPEDLDGIGAEQRPSGEIRLAYLGQIYPGVQDFSPLFRALRAISDSDPDLVSRVRLEYAGQSFPVLYGQAADFGMERVLRNHGFVSRAEALRLEKNADLLLLTVWDNRKSEVLPAKLLEYMMMDRPVLAMITGDRRDRLVKRIMDTTCLGYTCEEADPSSGDALHAWLGDALRRASQDGRVPFLPSSGAIGHYAYPSAAKRLESRLLLLCEEKKHEA